MSPNVKRKAPRCNRLLLHCAQFPALLPSFSSVFGSNLLNDAELMHIDPVLERLGRAKDAGPGG
jgi:hypothetical protein